MLILNSHIKNKKIAQIIPEKEIFDRKDLLRYSRKIDPEFLDTSVRNLLEYLLKSGKVARVGRNQYIKILKFEKSQKYSYHYSKESKSIMKTLQSRYPHLEYRVWELSWLNEFLNHQIAQNKIFIEVESIGCEYVFEELNKEYKGKILLKPNDEELYRYGGHNTIVVCKLVSEAPKGEKKYENPLEKLIVDLYANKTVKSLIHSGERDDVVRDITNKYYIDKSKLLRYASRRSKKEEIERILSE